jgi:hypothetical protein
MAAAIVFGVACGIVASMFACLKSLKELEEDCRRYAIVKFLFWLLVLFGGPITATGAVYWSYIHGGVLICVPLTILARCCVNKSRKQAQHVKNIAELCPKGTAWDSKTTIDEVISVFRGSMLLTSIDSSQTL